VKKLQDDGSMASELTIFICRDVEGSWHRHLAERSEREMLEWERDELVDEEARLGRLALDAAEEDSCDPDEYLPDYAPRPYEIQLPEVFET
jgi:hypothetical protein